MCWWPKRFSVVGEFMACHEGFLDYGSGRYKLMGRPRQDDYYFHAGEWLEVWRETRWEAVQVLADLVGR